MDVHKRFLIVVVLVILGALGIYGFKSYVNVVYERGGSSGATQVYNMINEDLKTKYNVWYDFASRKFVKYKRRENED